MVRWSSLGRALQASHEPARVKANGLGKIEQLDNVDAALASLHRCHKGLMAAERAGDISLGQACLLPGRRQELAHDPVPRASQRPWHCCPPVRIGDRQIIGFPDYLKIRYSDAPQRREKAQPNSISFRDKNMSSVSPRPGILARLPAPIFWTANVCISLIAGAGLFLFFGTLATALNASEVVVFLIALTTFVVGVAGTFILLNRRRRGRSQVLESAAGHDALAHARERREPTLERPDIRPGTASGYKLDIVIVEDDQGPNQNSTAPKLDIKELGATAIVAIIAAIAIGAIAANSDYTPAMGVDGLLGLLGSAVCNTLDAIGARSFMPEACFYSPVKAAHHLIVVFGSILLIEEFLRRVGSSSKNDTSSKS